MLTVLFACLSPESTSEVRSPTPTEPAGLAAATPADPDLVYTAPDVPIVARAAASATSGTFPLVVAFDASSSQVPDGAVAFHWSFGDGDVAAGSRVVHTYLGPGAFDATLTVSHAGGAASAAVAIDVLEPGCPSPAEPVKWGTVDDSDLDELSGLVQSPSDPDTFWVQEDSGNPSVLVALNASGATLSRHALPSQLDDWEDLAAAVDPETGVSKLFFADIGDNGYRRKQIAVWIADEPNAATDAAIDAHQLVLTYPDGSHNAETLLVDPLTLDLYIVTKVSSGPASVYVKRAPHDGSAVLEALGERATMAFTATGGGVSADGTRIVVRDYTSTARVWIRDGYRPLEDAFDEAACEVAIHSEKQGEAIALVDGGLVTVSEGVGQPLYFIGL